ncbi:MAG: hypothetical protein K8U57_05045 [Planctomycetes bacterium]|nr:hypothetical protein [Planctomycetota bacterium]
MHVHDALDRLDLIHNQLTRSEVYRGFREPAVAAVGLLAFAAATVQPLIPGATEGIGFVWFWVAIAGVGGLLGTSAAIHAYATREDDFARRRTRRVMTQFAPCLLVGGTITIGFARVPELAAFLPGVWAAVLGLGLVAASPHLPTGIGLVALGYVAAGAFQLLRCTPGDNPDGWAVGSIFGVGHLLSAWVLWRGSEEAEEYDDE